MKVLKSYNVQIWVGLRKMYDKEIYYNINDVRSICTTWINKEKNCVTITQTEFIYLNGSEPGVIIGLISYPRFPKLKKEIRKDAIELGYLLMTGLNQYRVTITTPKKSYMLENINLK